MDEDREKHASENHTIRSGRGRGSKTADQSKHATPPDRWEVGWEASCGHSDARPVPATVFDPFNGSGTSLWVARQLGRRAVGVDLSLDYCRLAQKRLEMDATVWSGQPRKVDDVPLGDLPMFGTLGSPPAQG